MRLFGGHYGACPRNLAFDLIDLHRLGFYKAALLVLAERHRLSVVVGRRLRMIVMRGHAIVTRMTSRREIAEGQTMLARIMYAAAQHRVGDKYQAR